MAVSGMLWGSLRILRPTADLLRPCAIAGRSYARGTGTDLPPPPKHPPNSYMLFLNVKRPSLISANPGIRVTEVAKATGELWRHLPEQERMKYHMEAKPGFEQYKVDFKKYLESLTPAQKAKRQEQRELKKKLKAKNDRKKMLIEFKKPKMQGNSGFSCFVKHNKLEPGQRAVEYISALAAIWRRMPTEDKEEYEQEAKVMRQRYHEDMEDWEKQMIISGHPELVRGYKPPKPDKEKTPKKKAAAKKTTAAKKKKSDSGDKKKKTPKKTKNKETQTDEDPSWMREE